MSVFLSSGTGCTSPNARNAEKRSEPSKITKRRNARSVMVGTLRGKIATSNPKTWSKSQGLVPSKAVTTLTSKCDISHRSSSFVKMGKSRQIGPPRGRNRESNGRLQVNCDAPEDVEKFSKNIE